MERQPGPLKRFLLFCGADYYPSGGWGDFVGDFETMEEALERKNVINEEWFQIVDIETAEVVTYRPD